MNRFLLLLFFSLVSAVLPAEKINLTFQEAQALALNNSEDLELARLGLSLTNQRLNLSYRIYFPHFSVEYTNSNSVETNEVDTKQHQVQFRLDQLLFDGGTNAAQLEISKIQLDLQQKALAQKYDELTDSIWNIYYNILILEEKIKIQRKNYEIGIDQLVIAKTQLELGEIREIDYIEAELQISNMYQGIVETEYQLEDAKFDFCQVLGISPEVEIILTETIDKEYNGSQITFTADDVYHLALKNNLDYQSLQAQLFQKQKEYDYLKRTYVPQLTGSFSLTFKGKTLPLGSPTWGASISVSFPDQFIPFSTTLNANASDKSTALSGNTSAGIAEDFTQPVSKREIETAIISLQIKDDQFKENLMTEIKRSLRSYENLKKRMLLGRRTLELQYSKLQILEKQYELGEIISLELLETRNEVVAAEIDMLEQILSILQTERSLERFMGFPPGSFSLLVLQPEELPDE